MKEKYDFCIFPISLIGNAFANIKETISKIFDYCVYKHSQKLDKGSELEKMKQAAHIFGINFGRSLEQALIDAKSLQTDLKSPLVKIDKSRLWDYYNNPKSESDIACFCAFCAIKSIIGDKDYIKTNKQFILARMFPQTAIKYAKEFTTYGEVSRYIKQKYKTHLSVTAIGKAVRAGRLNYTERPDAIKKITWKIYNRADVDSWYCENNDTEKTLIEKYSQRYQIGKVLLCLQTDWGLKLYGDRSRGFYLSFNKTLKELATINESAKTKNKIKQLVELKKKAKIEALKEQQLMSNP
jgi:hypothetical protein